MSEAAAKLTDAIGPISTRKDRLRIVTEHLDSATAELRRELEEWKQLATQSAADHLETVNGLERTVFERDALKREVEGLREFARDVWTTLSKDLHHGEGFNKKLFRDRAGEFFEQDKSPQKYS